MGLKEFTPFRRNDADSVSAGKTTVLSEMLNNKGGAKVHWIVPLHGKTNIPWIS